jgi:hypothetical protein
LSSFTAPRVLWARKGRSNTLNLRVVLSKTTNSCFGVTRWSWIFYGPIINERTRKLFQSFQISKKFHPGS